MKLLNITIEGLFSYKDRSLLSLDTPGLTLIEGIIDNEAGVSNGSGKSSIIDAICLCLFKTTTKGIEGDTVVNDDSDSGYAMLDFVNNDGVYQAQYIRDKSLKKTIWKIFVYDNVGTPDEKLWDISGKTLSDTETVIQQLIGMNYNTFSNSILFAQNGVSLFLEGRDSDRKRLFTQILDLDVLDEALSETRKSISAINDEIKAREQAIKNNNIAIDREKEVHTELNEAKAKVIEILERMEKIHSYIDIIKSVEDKIKARDSHKDQIVLIDNRIKEINNDININESNNSKRLSENKIQLELFKSSLEKIPSSREILVEQKQKLYDLMDKELLYSNYNEEKAHIEKGIAVLESNSKSLSSEVMIIEDKRTKIVDQQGEENCPYCGQSLDTETINSVYKKLSDDIYDKMCKIADNSKDIALEAEILEKKTRNIEPIKEFLDDGKTRITITLNIENLNAIIANKDYWESQVKHFEESDRSVRLDYLENLKTYNERKTKLELEKHEHEQSIEGLDNAINSVTLPEKSQDELEFTLRMLNKEKDTLNTTIGAKQQELDSIQNCKDSNQEKQREILTFQDELKYEKFLEEMFGADGIKSLIITSITPRLTDLANYYLEQTNDKPIAIEFVTSYEGKSKVIDDFKILITRGSKTSDVRSFSGGERKKIEIAVRFAISDIIREKSGCSAEFLFLDEIFDALDERSIDLTVKLLRGLNERFPSIFSISHIAYSKNEFDNVITVENKYGYSKIKE